MSYTKKVLIKTAEYLFIITMSRPRYLLANNEVYADYDIFEVFIGYDNAIIMNLYKLESI